MPRFNGTGPLGFGPGTGWGMGPCRGFGRFWRFGSQVPQKDEKQMLEEEAKILGDELKAVKDRLNELKEQ